MTRSEVKALVVSHGFDDVGDANLEAAIDKVDKSGNGAGKIDLSEFKKLYMYAILLQR